jgi:hypothetical protein
MKGAEPMISMEVRVCVIDNVPYEDSLVYKTILEELGKEDADKWTKVIDVPGDP